jgi:hypothetical protein
MARNKPVTEAELSDFLDRLFEVGIEANDMADRIAKSFALDETFDQSASYASTAASAAYHVSDLAHKLTVVVRHRESMDRTRKEFEALHRAQQSGAKG